MSFLQICLLAVIGVLLAIVLKNEKAEYSQYISFFVCIVILLVTVKELKTIFSWVSEIVTDLDGFLSFMKILIKMIGISYASEITISLCKDAGYASVANGIEILTRVLLCYLSLPVLKEVLYLLEQYL